MNSKIHVQNIEGNGPYSNNKDISKYSTSGKLHEEQHIWDNNINSKGKMNEI